MSLSFLCEIRLKGSPARGLPFGTMRDSSQTTLQSAQQMSTLSQWRRAQVKRVIKKDPRVARCKERQRSVWVQMMGWSANPKSQSQRPKDLNVSLRRTATGHSAPDGRAHSQRASLRQSSFRPSKSPLASGESIPPIACLPLTSFVPPARLEPPGRRRRSGLDHGLDGSSLAIPFATIVCSGLFEHPSYGVPRQRKQL